MSTVEVRETVVFASTQGADWWTAFLMRYESSGRIETIAASLGGNLVSVQCDDKEHAEWLVEHAVSNGIPRTALKVTK